MSYVFFSDSLRSVSCDWIFFLSSTHVDRSCSEGIVSHKHAKCSWMCRKRCCTDRSCFCGLASSAFVLRVWVEMHVLFDFSVWNSRHDRLHASSFGNPTGFVQRQENKVIVRRKLSLTYIYIYPNKLPFIPNSLLSSMIHIIFFK